MTREFENEIIKSVLAGNADAFEPLMAEYQRGVYNLALRMTANPEDAADMTQETFIKAYRSLASFRGESKFSAWIYRIASNVCLDFLRSRSKKPSASLTQSDGEDEAELEIADTRPGPEELLLSSLTRDAVRRGLDRLPPEQKQILLLREISGLSYEEIGQALRLESGTVKSRIFRARRRLCAFLLEDGNIPDKNASVNSKGGAEA